MVKIDEEGLSEKVLFRGRDGNSFEAVLLRYTNRNTICASSQIGCPIACSRSAKRSA